MATARPFSLAERLYGRIAKPGTTQHIHPDRLHMGAENECDDTDDDSNDPPDSWAPTGANMLSLGSRSIDDMTSSTFIAPTQRASLVHSAGNRKYLKAAPVSFLPPPGSYYDEPALRRVLDFKFTKARCCSCWNPKSACTKRGTCVKTCKVCGTDEHRGKTCPLLYCTFGWFLNRGMEADVLKAEDRQFRPTPVDFPILVKKGYIKTPVGHLDMAVAEGSRAMLMRTDEPAPPAVKTGSKVNISLDPHLQGNFAYLNMSKASSPATSDSVSSTPQATVPTMTSAYTTMDNATESRLQELEDEVLKLKMENVQKDREIRRLKTENMTLCGMNDEPGQKRQRI
ncbi:hypothetical protein DE146DRAFT_781020 [Phaeosphaeria sp. MPI-PUGE-AT-0046c]|nr:hypothetical protein DE146DRAFT_781020 [Phaeosphaeria sp. MPI-PUGE-AT-0046c]